MSSEYTQCTNWKSDQVGSIMSTVGDVKDWKRVYFDNPTITGYGVHCSHTRCMSCMLYCCSRRLPSCSLVSSPYEYVSLLVELYTWYLNNASLSCVAIEFVFIWDISCIWHGLRLTFSWVCSCNGLHNICVTYKILETICNINIKSSLQEYLLDFTIAKCVCNV